MSDNEEVLIRIKNLESSVRDLRIRNNFLQERCLMYQKLFADFVFFNMYTNSNECIDYGEIFDTATIMMINKDMQSITDDDSMYKKIFSILFRVDVIPFEYTKKELNFDVACLLCVKDPYESIKMYIEAKKKNKPVIYAEGGFISSILPMSKNGYPKEYRQTHSILIDTNCMYTDARHVSDLEYMLNTIEVTESQIERAKNNIKSLLKHKISKYNNQPIKDINIGNKNKKVLVIDQVWSDTAISLGLATDDTFQYMLDCAIMENPNTDIIVKTHPETNGTFYKTHFDMNKSDIYIIDYDINPYCLLENVDKVYVCTSQLGLEAVMCGKEVHTFGMPFYGGWGLTHDRLKCDRRTKKRSLEELFYIVYIMYTHYVSYKTNSRCQIEQCIDEMIELREKFNKVSV